MNIQTEYSIVIPVYNSFASLGELSSQVRKAMEEIGDAFEVIMVDDGSTDNSWSKMEEIHREDNRFKIIQLFRNFGQHNSTLCGIAHSSGRYIITLDSDLEHSPEDIPKLLNFKEHDIVIGQIMNKKHGFLKKIASRIKDGFIHKLVGAPKGIQISSFRMFKRGVGENMIKVATPYPYIPALMFFVSKDVKGVPIGHSKRKYGSTTYTLRKMISLFSNLMINNSSYLLRIIGQFGGFISIAGFILASYLVLRWIIAPVTFPGWTSLMVLVLIFSGLILIALGVIGEYLIRIINSIEKRPSYIERIVIK